MEPTTPQPVTVNQMIEVLSAIIGVAFAALGTILWWILRMNFKRHDKTEDIISKQADIQHAHGTALMVLQKDFDLTKQSHERVHEQIFNKLKNHDEFIEHVKDGKYKSTK